MEKTFFSNLALIILMQKLFDEKNYEAVVKLFQSHLTIYSQIQTPTNKEISQELPMNTLNVVFSALLKLVRFFFQHKTISFEFY